MEKLAFTHLIGDVMVFVALTMVTVFAAKEVHANGFKEVPFVTSNFPLALSYAVFAFEGVGVVLPIMEITENEDQYFTLLTATLIVICTIFVSFAEFAAFAYGPPVFSETEPGL